MVTAADITLDIDLEAPGKRAGSYHVPHSSDAHPFGFRGPLGVVQGAPGPTLALIGGVHGDEYQGPTVISRLFHELDPATLTGRVLCLPALNFPAYDAAARCSPLDRGNMNRAFKTARQDLPTEAIAGWLETRILPQCSAAVDFHAGGKASVFAPVAMINCGEAEAAGNIALAEAFGLPLIWKMGAMNSTTSLNAAASRVGIPMMACELGGAGGTDRRTNAMAYAGSRGVLRHLEMIDGSDDAARPTPLMATLPGPDYVVTAPKAGLFEPKAEPEDHVEKGDLIGVIHDVVDLAQPPAPVYAPGSGVMVMRIWRSTVPFGARIAMLLKPE